MTSVPFIDTLDPAYDADIHAVHRAARERSWYARTPIGLIFLRYEDVLWLLRDRRWRQLGADALVAAGITDGPLHEWFRDMMSTRRARTTPGCGGSSRAPSRLGAPSRCGR